MADLPDLLVSACRGTLGGPDKVELSDALKSLIYSRGPNDYAVQSGPLLAALRDGPGAETARLRAEISELNRGKGFSITGQEADALRDEIGRLSVAHDSAVEEMEEIAAERDVARAENERLRDALEAAVTLFDILLDLLRAALAKEGPNA